MREWEIIYDIPRVDDATEYDMRHPLEPHATSLIKKVTKHISPHKKKLYRLVPVGTSASKRPIQENDKSNGCGCAAPNARETHDQGRYCTGGEGSGGGCKWVTEKKIWLGKMKRVNRK